MKPTTDASGSMNLAMVAVATRAQVERMEADCWFADIVPVTTSQIGRGRPLSPHPFCRRVSAEVRWVAARAGEQE